MHSGAQPLHSVVIFSDFDGTITKEETYIGALSRMCDPDVMRLWLDRLHSGEYPMKTCWKSMFASIPSDRIGRIEGYTRGAQVRAGFSELLTFASERDIPFIVVSGGISLMQKEILKPYEHLLTARYGCDLDTSGTYMSFSSAYEDETSVMGKPGIMRRYPARLRICIGDGVTDLDMADAADIVFARDYLAEELTAKDRAFYPYETFFDVVNVLKRLLPSTS